MEYTYKFRIYPNDEQKIQVALKKKGSNNYVKLINKINEYKCYTCRSCSTYFLRAPLMKIKKLRIFLRVCLYIAKKH